MSDTTLVSIQYRSFPISDLHRVTAGDSDRKLHMGPATSTEPSVAPVCVELLNPPVMLQRCRSFQEAQQKIAAVRAENDIKIQDLQVRTQPCVYPFFFPDSGNTNTRP